jgi:hypothetical protein
MAHPWSLTSLNDAAFGPNAMRHLEQSLAATAGTGLPTPARLELIAAVDDYVAGNVLHSVEALARAAAVEYGLTQLQAGDFPQLSALYNESSSAQAAEQAGPPMTETALAAQFERGLHALLDGIAARMNRE